MKATKQSAAQKFEAEEIKEAVKDNNYYENRIREALEAQEVIDKMKKIVDEIKVEFMDMFKEDGTITQLVTAAGTVTLKESNSYSIEPLAVPELKKIFKKQYSVFVAEKTTYGCTAALKKLLGDGDYKHIDSVRESVMISTSQSVKFSPVKELKVVKGKK